MADLVRRYLLCCLPQPRPDALEGGERQPLLDPDVLPQAPPRQAPTQTTEEHEREQHLRRRILNLASERLVNILSPNPFTSTPSPQLSPPSSPSPSRSPSDSLASSPTLTSATRRVSWRPPPDAPIAPVRVVHVGKNWQVVDPHEPHDPSSSSSSAEVAVDPFATPSTMRRQRRERDRGGQRPPSSHSMRTLPKRRGGHNRSSPQPSPLRGHATSQDNDNHDDHDGRDEAGNDEDEDEDVDLDVDGDNDGESRFGTVDSYRTAASSGGSRFAIGLRDIWATADDAVVAERGELDPARQRDLDRAVAELERSIDDWKLQPVGPIVADLADYKPSTTTTK